METNVLYIAISIICGCLFIASSLSEVARSIKELARAIREYDSTNNYLNKTRGSWELERIANTLQRNREDNKK